MTGYTNYCVSKFLSLNLVIMKNGDFLPSVGRIFANELPYFNPIECSQDEDGGCYCNVAQEVGAFPARAVVVL